MAWAHKIALKYLYTDKEDHETIQAVMNNIADAIDRDREEHFFMWLGFNTKPFRSIPEGDSFFGPVDYANVLLNRLYDYADQMRIWIE